MNDSDTSAWLDYQERDCPWWDPDWLNQHPDFPITARVAATGTGLTSAAGADTAAKVENAA